MSFPRLLTLFPRTLSRYRPMVTSATNEWKLVDGMAKVPYRVYNKPIVTSQLDDRDYRLIQLDNGIEAMLIHDPKADKSAASLDVAVGHLSDPDDMPGLAHFCEHLLFMGTESFPKENAYAEYLAQNNGRSNAYTSTTNTNYYFNVATSALPGALERFSAFFHCPLFSPSCTSRELNAVHSEHQSNYQNDIWRIFQLNKHLSPPGHVWSKFGSGNKDSLLATAREMKRQGKLVHRTPSISHTTTPLSSRTTSPAPSTSSSSNISEGDEDGGLVGRETRRRLVEWWSKEYCSSRMRLCILGKESLDELSELTARLFSPILNRGRDALPMIDSNPVGNEQKGTLVLAQTVMQLYAVEISFPLEYQPPLWKYKPANFISHFVGHEGPGSLNSHLKQKRWITSLSAGHQNVARGIARFAITIHLTPEGFANYRSVVSATFSYLAFLRSSKFETYHQQEVVQLSDIQFRFLDKRRVDDYVVWVAEHLSWPVPRHLLLASPHRIWAWDSDEDKIEGAKKVAEYLESFRIENGRVTLMAKKNEHMKLQANLQWDKEPWYDTEYVVQRWEPGFIEKANVADMSGYFLPGPNKFIPSQLDVDKKDAIEVQKRPRLIRQTPMSTLWYKKDDIFWVPKAHVVIDLCSPKANMSARSAVLTRLYCELVVDALTEYAYDAELAGLSYRLFSHATGLCVLMDGYNDKMFVFVHTLLQRIKNLEVDPQRFEVEKESLQREYSNFFLGHSYQIAIYHSRYLLSETQWRIEDKLQELSGVTADDLQQYIKDFASQVNLRILVVGNVYKDEAIKIAETAEEGLGHSPLSADELNERALLLPSGSNSVFRAPIPNPNQANSSLSYFTRYGPVADQKLRVTSALLTQILDEPSFNVLRTREQLGYVVFCSTFTLPGLSESGLRFVIQSEKKPEYLEKRLEAFLDEMKIKLDTMSDEDFTSHRSGLEKKWLEADKNISEEVAKYAVQVTSGHWDFLRDEKDAALLKTITKADVFDLFMTKVHPSSPTRGKLSVQMVSQKPRPQLVSSAAAQAFEVLVRNSIPDIDEKAWRTSVTEETPSLIDFGRYWVKVLVTDEGKKVLAQLPALLKEYPVVVEDDDVSLARVTYIKNQKDFKAGLVPVVNPGPLEQWNDLPQPRI